MKGEPFHVKMAFQPAAAAYVSERTWSDDQMLTSKADGSVILEFTATSRPEVLSWVLSFRAEAELMAPEDLRQELTSIVEKIADVYAPDNLEVPSSPDRPGSWLIS